MRIKCTIYFFICVIFLGGCHSSQNPKKIFGNMTYYIGKEYSVDKVTLKDGKYEDLNYYHAYYENKYVYGDFNKDGLKDAAVIIAESGGGSGYFLTLAFLINDGKQLVHRGSQYLGDRVIVNSLKEQSGNIVVDMFVHREGDCMAGPTNHVKNTYIYENRGVFRFLKNMSG